MNSAAYDAILMLFEQNETTEDIYKSHLYRHLLDPKIIFTHRALQQPKTTAHDDDISDQQTIDLRLTDRLAELESSLSFEYKICVKCGRNKWTTVSVQTRSADEGETIFYKCLTMNCAAVLRA